MGRQNLQFLSPLQNTFLAYIRGTCVVELRTFQFRIPLQTTCLADIRRTHILGRRDLQFLIPLENTLLAYIRGTRVVARQTFSFEFPYKILTPHGPNIYMFLPLWTLRARDPVKLL